MFDLDNGLYLYPDHKLKAHPAFPVKPARFFGRLDFVTSLFFSSIFNDKLFNQF
jgi:hypothetical protein